MHRLLVIAMLASMACESSATDHERQREETERLLAFNARSAEHNRRVAERTRYADEIERAFAARFAGRVEPGVGCDACPDLCRIADLRSLDPHALRANYRSAARAHGYPDDDRSYQLAALELVRLGCIAKGERALQRAWLRLLDGGEAVATRYFAAVQAIELGFAADRPRRVLVEVSRGSSKFAPEASAALDQWTHGVEPSL